MKHPIPSLGLLAALTIPAAAQLKINELDADQPNTDTTEFIELYDGGAGSTSLAGYVLVFFNGGATNNTSYAAFDLDSYSTDANGYFVAGNAAVPGVDLTLGSNAIQNGPDAVALYLGNATDFPNGTLPTTTNLVDAIAYGTSADSALIAALGLSTHYNELENGSTVNQSISRIPDGGAVIGIVDPSPGAANPSPGGALGVSLDITSISESDAGFITGTVTTPSNVSGDLAVTVSLSDSSEAISADTTILDGTNSASFFITPVNDAWPDGPQVVTVTVSAATYDPDDTTFTVTDDDTTQKVVINEVFNQVTGALSDANGDGTANTNDEFVEILNVSGGPLDLSGATLADASFDRHYFPAGTVLEDGCALLVFAGGNIAQGSTAAFGNTPVQIALADPGFPGLFLGDTGDTVKLIDTLGTISGGFGAELHSVTLPDQSAAVTASSITTATDGDAASGHVLHTSVSANPYSPGTTPAGAPYCVLSDTVALTITPGTYTEADGLVAAAGTVSIPSARTTDLVVYLDSSDVSEISTATTSPVTIPATQTSVSIDLQFVDDSNADGTQAVTLTARAIGYLNSTASVDVEDAGDTPTFTNLVINEIDADQTGTDTAEFIELYNNTSTEQSLNGLILVLFNGSNDTSYGVIDLAGEVIPANGFFVIGNTAVPNVDRVLGANGLQNGQDAVALIAGSAAAYPNGTPVGSITGTLVDALVYNGADAGLQAALDPTGTSVSESATTSLSRVPDGGVGFSSASFVAQEPTPGATNVLPDDNFGTWAAANGIANEPFGDDFDGDGIPNGVEYAIAGLDPTAFDSLASAFSGGTLSFTKRAEAVANGDVVYAIEVSTDLGAADPWTEATAPGYTNNGTTISYALPGGQTRLFARLSVSELGVVP